MVTAFRDGFQSFFGARVRTPDFLPAFEAAVDAGIRHLEVGGGARFQSLYFYCNEDAFEMMDTLREKAGPQAELQTLARGTNVVGLESQPREIIDLHAKLFARHGISKIRNFDALNDVNNLIYSGRAIAEAGLRHEVTVTLMGLPPGLTGAHTPDFYIGVLRNILDAEIPYESVCFKDASGTTPPAIVGETIRRARTLLGEGARISFHSHESAGISIQQYVSALHAGADQVDCSLAPVSGGTAQPDVLTLYQALQGSDVELDIDVHKIREVEQILGECLDDYFIPPEALGVKPSVLFSPMPGGALTANTQMMRDHGILDRYPKVANAMTEVIAKGGFGTSVTPVSQFYFQQAFNNVMFGPWERFADGYGKMVLGYFGKTPMPPDPEIVRLAQRRLQLDPTERPPIDINDEDPEKGIAAARRMLDAEQIEATEENLFIAATCKEKGITFLKGEAHLQVRKKEQVDPGCAEDEAVGYTVGVNGAEHHAVVEGDRVVIDGTTFTVQVHEARSAAEDAPRDSAGASPAGSSPRARGSSRRAGAEIKAPFAALLLRVEAPPGTCVNKGDTVVVLESMKMETELSAPIDGTVAAVHVTVGDQVENGGVIATLDPL
jgi:pyruvate carboxylase subunit B